MEQWSLIVSLTVFITVFITVICFYTESELLPATETVNASAVEVPENQATLAMTNPGSTSLEEQQQDHLRQIQLLQQKLQEQQRINEQQQQQLRQQQLLPPGVVTVPQETQPPHQTEGSTSAIVESQRSSIPPTVVGQQRPKFQLQPEVYAQIQALTGENYHGLMNFPTNSRIVLDCIVFVILCSVICLENLAILSTKQLQTNQS